MRGSKKGPLRWNPPTTAPAYDEFVSYGPLDKAGFFTKVVDGRLWVIREGTKDLADFQKYGELAKHVTVPGGGPNGMTVKAPDQNTIYAYNYSVARPGFVTEFQGGRLWVFRPGSKDLNDFHKAGELAKHVTLPGVGPLGVTVKSPDTQTALAYLASRPGFVTVVRNERLWVVRPGSKDMAELKAAGEIGKHVTRPGAGPLGATVQSPDTETLNDYLATLETTATIN